MLLTLKNMSFQQTGHIPTQENKLPSQLNGFITEESSGQQLGESIMCTETDISFAHALQLKTMNKHNEYL